uniref:Uncharacterized protein n=1 Tax=Rangifer tarandus platyrhynchus TaxID=3082113 RepID=A0ACB0EEC6_RANTA|nr:unnamed protein product [Rangifer tarandus platyrhynchus]
MTAVHAVPRRQTVSSRDGVSYSRSADSCNAFSTSSSRLAEREAGWPRAPCAVRPLRQASPPAKCLAAELRSERRKAPLFLYKLILASALGWNQRPIILGSAHAPPGRDPSPLPV